jgi:hypothetical protein
VNKNRPRPYPTHQPPEENFYPNDNNSDSNNPDVYFVSTARPNSASNAYNTASTTPTPVTTVYASAAPINATTTTATKASSSSTEVPIVYATSAEVGGIHALPSMNPGYASARLDHSQQEPDIPVQPSFSEQMMPDLYKK